MKKEFEQKIEEYGFTKNKGFNYSRKDDGLYVEVYKFKGEYCVLIGDLAFEEFETKKAQNLEEVVDILDSIFMA